MRQIDLFTTPGSPALEPELELDAEGLLAWQQRVLQYQQQQARFCPAVDDLDSECAITDPAGSGQG